MVPLVSAIGSIASELQAATSAPSTAAPSGASFGEMVTQAARDAVNTMQQGEAAVIEGVKGAMPTFKVADAVMSAQRTLQQSLAIRDKAVSAFQDISRMSI